MTSLGFGVSVILDKRMVQHPDAKQIILIQFRCDSGVVQIRFPAES